MSEGSQTKPDELALKKGEAPIKWVKVSVSLPEKTYLRLQAIQFFQGYPSMSAVMLRAAEHYLENGWRRI